MFQGAALHALIIDKRSVQAVEVLDNEAALFGLDFGVTIGDGQIIDGDGIVGPSSNRNLTSVCSDLLQNRAFKFHDQHGHFPHLQN